MKMYYSAETNAFYPGTLRVVYEKAGTWPSDAMEVSNDVYATFGASEPPKGMQRAADGDGHPVWVPIPPLDLQILTARKRAEIDAASVAALAQVRSEYPDYEQLSWERQEREARDGGGPLIHAIADARGLPLEELINRIIAKADAYQTAAGVVIGRRQALRDQIDAIESDEDFDDDAKRVVITGITW